MITARKVLGAGRVGRMYRRNAILPAPVSEVNFARFRTVSALKTVFTKAAPLSVTVSPAASFGAVATSAPSGVTTSDVTAITAGGTAPFAFVWSEVGVSAADWSIFATGASAYFYADAVAAGSPETATFKCTVTDATGLVMASANVIATARNYGGLE